jgi:hypothetical protein
VSAGRENLKKGGKREQTYKLRWSSQSVVAGLLAKLLGSTSENDGSSSLAKEDELDDTDGTINLEIARKQWRRWMSLVDQEGREIP